MSKDTVKKLNITNINKELRKLDEKYKVQVYSNMGTIYELSINKYFKEKPIADMIVEFMINYEYSRNNKIQITDILDEYILFLVIKHFTSIGSDFPSKVEDQIILLWKLIELGLLKNISEVLPSEQLEKIMNRVEHNMINKYNEISSIYEKMEEAEREVLMKKEEDKMLEELKEIENDALDVDSDG
ncbi:hypothetical protein B7C51_25225 (plasmid) [Paenibacillus larvae subsp. pulvifaciens]|uniref:Uncharacterized protein n=1 Tax=Paenibacillus larvae subsp. pulvifaciens TaxID=1477 RepID=A0A1V0UZX3_9BACL|nr:hypothetical protein [Paenibacillus larvae]ARF70775.1 hypothetical protein B7C51_25225 [Paenibacillus larvae subsp. pulvifaciens]